MEREKREKATGKTQDNRSFLAKYVSGIMYIVFSLIFQVRWFLLPITLYSKSSYGLLGRLIIIIIIIIIVNYVFFHGIPQ